MKYPGADFDATAAALLSPSDYVNPQPRSKYHLVVLGAGPAGLIAAIGAAGLGARVALIEAHQMGGDCLNVGCVPSKALLEYTRSHPQATFDEAFRWLRQVRAGIAPHDSVARYCDAGVDVFLGRGDFDERGRICVDGAPLNARRTLICTGARAVVPPIAGLAECQPLTNETVFDLSHKPDSLAILGAGAIGCELALVFARLGVEVHLFELSERVLPLEMPAAGEVVGAALSSCGVKLHLGDGVDGVSRDTGVVHVTAGDARVAVDEVLVALGRRPNTGSLGLEHAGVTVDDQGFIVTDARLRTSNKRIYAAGDCTARLQFTHHADAQARVVVQNALFAPTAKADALVVPHCTYTQPEVASVGASEQELQGRGVAYDTYQVRFDELDRGRAENDTAGFACVRLRQGTDEILSATVVGHDAGEQIAPICLLMSNGLGLSAAGKAILPYPTRAEYLKRLADAYNRNRLTPFVARLFKAWMDLTG